METATETRPNVIATTPEFMRNAGAAKTETGVDLVRPEGAVIDVPLWQAFRAEVHARRDDPARAWSLSVLHRRTGISTSAWSKWLAGKPEGNVARLEDVARRFLSRERANEMLPPIPTEFVRTRLADAIEKSIETIWYGGWFGLITAPHGCGSTTACARYAKSKELPVLVQAQTGETSLWAMVALLYARLTNRTNERRRFTPRLEYIREHLVSTPGKTGEGRLVIVDGAEMLDAQAIRFFRDLHVRNHLPVVFVAKPPLAARLQEIDDVAYHVYPHLRMVPVHRDGPHWFSEPEVREFAHRFVRNPDRATLKQAHAIANADGHLAVLGSWLRLMQFYVAAGKSPLRAMQLAGGQLLRPVSAPAEAEE